MAKTQQTITLFSWKMERKSSMLFSMHKILPHVVLSRLTPNEDEILGDNYKGVLISPKPDQEGNKLQ